MKPSETIDFHIKSNWLGVAALYNQLAFKHGLTQATGFVLLNIDKEGTAATKIAPIMGMRNTSLSRILKKMEEDGLVSRKADTSDKRSVKIHLTAMGSAKKQIAKKVVKKYNQFILSQITEEEKDCFFKVMGKIGKLTEAYKIKNLSDE
jgi:DNA-binding MarR family transcriptional regulator